MKFTTVLPILLLPTSVTANRDLFKKIRANDNTEFGRDDTAEFGVSPKQTKNGRNLRTRSLQLDLSMSMPDFEAASMSLPNVPTYAPTAPTDTPTYFPTALDGSTNKDNGGVSVTFTTENEDGSTTLTQINVGGSSTHSEEDVMMMLSPKDEGDANVPTYTPTYFPTALDGSTNKDKVSVVDTVHGAVDTVDGAVDTVGDAVDTVDGAVDTVGDAVDTVDGAVDTVGDAVDTVSDVVSKLDGVLSWISGFFGRRN